MPHSDEMMRRIQEIVEEMEQVFDWSPKESDDIVQRLQNVAVEVTELYAEFERKREELRRKRYFHYQEIWPREPNDKNQDQSV